MRLPRYTAKLVQSQRSHNRAGPPPWASSSGPGEQAGERMTELISGAHQSDTHQKALRINLDPRWYGTIAEIGAGQEVVRWFFRVGGALGTVGVNLLYGAFFQHHEPDKLIENLLDRLTTGRIEIDMIQFRGIEFRGVDNRLMALKLVQLGLSGVAMFGPDREVLQPSEVLRKKAILVERGSFRPPTHVNLDMLHTAKARFSEDPAVAGKPVLMLTEITMHNLLAGGAADVDRRDFLARAELLAACGMTVLISDYFDYYRLAPYIAERTTEQIGIVMGGPSP